MGHPLPLVVAGGTTRNALLFPDPFLCLVFPMPCPTPLSRVFRPWFVEPIRILAAGLVAAVVCVAMGWDAQAAPLAAAVFYQEDAGDDDGEIEDGLVVVKGQFERTGDDLADFDLTELEGVMIQQVALQQPEFPADWESRSVEARRAWMTEFQESDDGRALIAANEKLLEDRLRFPVAVDSEGEFVIYDVPPGDYSLAASAERKAGDERWIVQAFGQITIGEVDEVELGAMPLESVRLLSMGEVAPALVGKDVDGRAITLEELRGKYVLLNFAVVTNPAYEQTVASLKQAVNQNSLADRLQIVTVAIDGDMDQLRSSIARQEMTWPVMALGSWDVGVLNGWGVKSVPSFWLIDDEGEIVLTGQQFLYEVSRADGSLGDLLDDAVAGRLVIESNEPSQTEGDD